MDDGLPHLTWPMKRVEKRLGRDLGEYLRERYVERGDTTYEIAAALGVGDATVRRWMAAYGIESRFPGQRKRPGAVAAAVVQ